jgi:aminopeptidase-like protein
MKTNYYYDLAKYNLRPIFKSITGSGIRKTLNLIKKEFPNLKIKKIKSNKKVFDWKVPP